MRWYRRAAEGGNHVAAVALGLLILSSGEPDPDEALRWLSDPASRGYAQAQYGMGLLALRAADHARARLWFAKAATQGHAGARSALASAGAADHAAA